MFILFLPLMKFHTFVVMHAASVTLSFLIFRSLCAGPPPVPSVQSQRGVQR